MSRADLKNAIFKNKDKKQVSGFDEISTETKCFTIFGVHDYTDEYDYPRLGDHPTEGKAKERDQ